MQAYVVRAIELARATGLDAACCHWARGRQTHVVQGVDLPPIADSASRLQPDVEAALLDGAGDRVVQKHGHDETHRRAGREDGVENVCAGKNAPKSRLILE